jgi:hypothetical protein
VPALRRDHLLLLTARRKGVSVPAHTLTTVNDPETYCLERPGAVKESSVDRSPCATPSRVGF